MGAAIVRLFLFILKLWRCARGERKKQKYERRFFPVWGPGHLSLRLIDLVKISESQIRMNKIITHDILLPMKITALLCWVVSLVLYPMSARTDEGAKPEDGIATSIKNSASDVDLATRKAIRWTKKQGRKVVGEDTATKRAQDQAADAKDEANNEAQKAENRAK